MASWPSETTWRGFNKPAFANARRVSNTSTSLSSAKRITPKSGIVEAEYRELSGTHADVPGSWESITTSRFDNRIWQANSVALVTLSKPSPVSDRLVQQFADSTKSREAMFLKRIRTTSDGFNFSITNPVVCPVGGLP